MNTKFMGFRENKQKIIKNENNVSFIETPDFYEIPFTSNDIYVNMSGQETLQDLAYKYYGDPKLWYFIAIANGLLLPFNVPNDFIIRIPPKSFII